MVIIEMNARVSRSSALTSKATGFPIAKIAAKHLLDEIRNDITRETPASFEPTIDCVVVKVPRFAFEKFPQADPTLTTQMKSVGEAMSIGARSRKACKNACARWRHGDRARPAAADWVAMESRGGSGQKSMATATSSRAASSAAS